MKKRPEKYWVLYKAIAERTTPFMTRLVRPGLMNPLYGLPDPGRTGQSPQPSSNERYWLDWLQELSEVDMSIGTLEQAVVYLSHYPGGRAFPFERVSEAEWMRYHVEAYLHEMYILEQRLGRFLRKVEKVCKAADDTAGLITVEELKAAVKDGLRNIVQIRSGHVHQSRFKDEELSNLDLALLFTRGGGKVPLLRRARQERHAAALQKWRKQMLANNRNLLNACVLLFEEVTKILVRNEPGASPLAAKGVAQTKWPAKPTGTSRIRGEHGS